MSSNTYNPGSFANRPHEEVVEAARKGGRASGGHARSSSGDTDPDPDPDQGSMQDDASYGDAGGAPAERQSSSGGAKGKQGFASMPREKVQEIAAKGGRSSGKSGNSGGDDADADEYDDIEEDA
ncbi:hypothetical protein OC834_004585 [Tilletia horrida]|uniref:Conidiation-specific protein 10 n=1 Tax=Tilletia horrida TaxID=155126 RepID=A0AAN6GHC1_9BASI|nr:hypothetical protein OC834_004585 [Tilletia horrida]KAK0540351.1 hypothetical protein OC842_000539 [Tilletia horrida]KAK0543812.1 hypothetical protein OC844_007547 [Tilletia horrida]